MYPIGIEKQKVVKWIIEVAALRRGKLYNCPLWLEIWWFLIFKEKDYASFL
jgi:hypothetical protein